MCTRSKDAGASISKWRNRLLERWKSFHIRPCSALSARFGKVVCLRARKKVARRRNVLSSDACIGEKRNVYFVLAPSWRTDARHVIVSTYTDTPYLFTSGDVCYLDDK